MQQQARFRWDLSVCLSVGGEVRESRPPTAPLPQRGHAPPPCPRGVPGSIVGNGEAFNGGTVDQGSRLFKAVRRSILARLDRLREGKAGTGAGVAARRGSRTAGAPRILSAFPLLRIWE